MICISLIEVALSPRVMNMRAAGSEKGVGDGASPTYATIAY